jgi:O-antigen/teichoic acid export membrane protein
MTDFGFSFIFSRQIAWSLTTENAGTEESSLHDFVLTRGGWRGVSDVYAVSARVFLWVAVGALVLMILIFHCVLPLGHLLDTATPHTTIAWYFLSAATLFTLLARAHQSMLEGTGRIYLSNFLFGTYQLACGVGVIIALKAHGQLVAMALTIVASACLFYAATRWSVQRYYGGLLDRRATPPPELTRKLLRVALPMGLLNFSSFLVSSVQVPLIGSLLGATSVSGFYIAQKISQLLNRLVSHLALPQMPLFTSELGARLVFRPRRRMQRTTMIIGVVSTMTFTIFYLLSPTFIRMWVGRNQYVTSVTLGLLSLDAIIMSVTVVMAQFVLASGRNPFVLSTLLTGLLNVAMLWFLLPRIGVAGAAASSLIAGLCINYWFTVWEGLMTLRQLEQSAEHLAKQE